MKSNPRIGLVPLYLAPYDEVMSEYRQPVANFARQVTDRLNFERV